MFSRSCWFVLLSCALGVMRASETRAEDLHDTAPPGYAEAINQALLELEANNLPEAREEFRRAHTIYPSARTLRGLGMVEFELRNYGPSARLLEQALASAARPLAGKLRSETELLLERARRYLGEVVVTLEPSSAALRVDGVKVPGPGALQLEVGQHVIEAEAAGYARERREIRVSGGERSEVILSLRALAARSLENAVAREGALRENQPSTSEAQPAYRKWWVWTIVAVAVAGGTTAAALLIAREPDRGSAAVRSVTTPNGVALQTLERF